MQENREGVVTSKGKKAVELNGFKKTVLALQHLIAMFGATVLVPIITGLNPAVALFSAGIGTLIFHICTKGKVPVFLGSSFAFIPAILTVKTLYGGDLRYAQGGIVAVGLIYVILSFVIKKIGVDKIRKVLPAQVVGPMIIVIGLNLIPDALKNAGVNGLLSGESGAIRNVLIASITLGLALIIKHYGKGMLKRVAILIAVAVGYGVSYAMGMVETGAISEATLFAVPNFTLPKLDLSAILIIVPVVLAVFMALTQLGIATSIVSSAFILILGGLALAFGLAFGLGGKEFARKNLEKFDQTIEETKMKDHE